MKRKTIVCFCMDVSEATLTEAFRQGFRNPELLKRFTGAFMGPCQGKMCAAGVLEQAARMAGVPVDTLRAPSCRPPLTPILLGTLAAEEKNQDPDDAAH